MQMNRLVVTSIPASLAALLLLNPGSALAQYGFVNIADSNGPLNGFGNNPGINAIGVVAFSANRDIGGSAIVRSNGLTSTTIAEAADGRYNSQFETYPAINAAGTVVFAAVIDATAETNGIFAGNGGSLTTVATDDRPQSVLDAKPGIAGDGAVVYTKDGAIHRFFNGSTTALVDASGRFTGAGGSSVNDAGMVAFLGSPDTGGVGYYRRNLDGTFTTITDSSGPLTGFASQTTISSDGKVAVFAARQGETLDTSESGVFVGEGSTFTAVATRSGPYSGFGMPAVNADGLVVFAAFVDDPDPEDAEGPVLGIFDGPDATTDKVIQVGDSLFGSTIADLDFYGGLNDLGQIAFRYELESGVTGIAVGVVPEPTSLALLGIGAICMRLRRR